MARNRVGLKENWVGYLPTQAKTRLEWATQRHWRGVQVHPGLTSWDILSRPVRPGQVLCGTGLAGTYTQHCVLGYVSAVPTGLVPIHLDARFVFQQVRYKLADRQQLIWTSLSQP